MYYSKYFTIFQEASMAGCVSAADLAKYIKRNGYSCSKFSFALARNQI